jgi:predicted negative regulator of RcsB-dependent stress response
MPQELIDQIMAFLTARVTQLVSRLLMAMAAAAGWEGFQAGAATQAITAGVMAIALFIFDLMVHTDRAQKIRAILGDLYDRVKGPGEGPPLDLKKLVPVVLLGAMLIGGATGCAGFSHVAHPQTQVETLTSKRLEWAAVKFTLAKVAGKADPQTKAAIAKAQKAGNDALAAYEKSVLAGETPDQAETKAFDAAVAELLKTNEDLGGEPVTLSPLDGAPAP